MQSLRLALLGAFAFPAPLGSQRFFAEQAGALRAAGAGVERFTYAAEGLTLRGFAPRKLAADYTLGRALLAAHGGGRFDAVLAHNAEATLLALSLRRRLGIPVVYVAHTLWKEEMGAWAPLPGSGRLGSALDRALARSADAVLVLSETARRALAAEAGSPIACIPPGHTPESAPPPETVAAACARHGLVRDAFALYAGNLDRYQDLAVLDAAAARGPRERPGPGEPGIPLVAVTHDARAARFRHLRVIEVDTIEEARLLTYGAAVAVLPRRNAGGFPLKLLHYMEAGRAIVARAGMAGALVHGESAWLLRDSAGPEDFAAAIRRLAMGATLRARLGAGARRALGSHHTWPAQAAETLALVRVAIERAASR